MTRHKRYIGKLSNQSLGIDVATTIWTCRLRLTGSPNEMSWHNRYDIAGELCDGIRPMDATQQVSIDNDESGICPPCTIRRP